MNALKEIIASRHQALNAQGWQNWLPNPDPVLKRLGKDISVYRELLADAHVGGCVRRRKAAVRSLEWRIDPGRSPARVVKAVEQLFKRLPIDTLLQEGMDAALFGYQPLEVIWEQNGGLWLPAKVVGKPPEWFCFDSDNALLFKTRQVPQGLAVPDYKFLLASQEASYQNPYGQADMARVFWPATFKKGGLRFWLTFTEKYGMPFLVGKLPRGSSAADTSELLGNLETMIQDAVAVIPDDSSVDLKEAVKTSSSDTFERLLLFCRSEISIALLGSNQTTEKDSNHASATAGAEVAKDLRDGDARMLERMLNTLIDWVCALNFDQAERPVFELFEQEEIDKTKAERDDLLTKSGARFTPAYFKREYGLQDGDLDEAAVPVSTDGSGRPPPNGTQDFAEADPASFPDQQALDAVVNGLAGLQDEAEALLRPVLDAIARAADETELLGLLAEAYPNMAVDALQERLQRLLFAAEVWGRLSNEA